MTTYMLPISQIEIDILRILTHRGHGYKKGDLSAILHTRSEVAASLQSFDTILWAMKSLNLVHSIVIAGKTVIRITEKGTSVLFRHLSETPSQDREGSA